MKKLILMLSVATMMLCGCGNSSNDDKATGTDATNSATEEQTTSATTQSVLDGDIPPDQITTEEKAPVSPSASSYPEGETPGEFIMVNGTLYVATGGKVAVVPSGFEEIGTVAASDNYSYPAEDLHASHVRAGCKVYANEDDTKFVYVETATNVNLRFEATTPVQAR